jgi:hypothetical protein
VEARRESRRTESLTARRDGTGVTTTTGMSMREMKGALYFSDEDIIGHFVIDDEHFQICGVRVNKIRADIKVIKTGDYQEDLFDGRSGDGGAQ